MRFITVLFHVGRRQFCIWIVGKRGSSGRESLIVATSNAGSASAGIGFGGAGNSGMVHAVSAVARIRLNGTVCNCVHVPASEFPSAVNLPSYVPLIPEKETLIFPFCTAIELLGMLAGP